MNLESIRTKGFIIKLMYFISFAGFASWLAYFNVYLKEVPKLSGFEIGVLAGLQQVNTIFVAPVWGMLADKYGRKKALSFSLVLSSVFLLIFMINTNFVFYILFVTALTIVYNPLTSLIDSIGLDYEEESKTTSFGQIRLWGSVGWAVSSAITGHFINEGNLSLIFPLAAGLIFITATITIFLYKPLKVQSGIQRITFKEIGLLLKDNKSLLNFLILVFVYAVLAAPTFLFINMYFNEIGATNSQIGIAYAVQALSELPFFFYGKRIVRRFGAKPMFVGVMFITAARLIFYGLNSNPWYAVAVGAIQGISIAFFVTSVVEYIHAIVPSKLRSTGQSMYYTFFSAGICVGNLFAGFMQDALTLQKGMIIDAGIIFILIVIMVARKKEQVGVYLREMRR